MGSDVMVLVMAAKEYYDRNLPIPVDLYMELNYAGLCPEQLEDMFEQDTDLEDIVYAYYESTWTDSGERTNG